MASQNSARHSELSSRPPGRAYDKKRAAKPYHGVAPVNQWLDTGCVLTAVGPDQENDGRYFAYAFGQSNAAEIAFCVGDPLKCATSDRGWQKGQDNLSVNGRRNTSTPLPLAPGSVLTIRSLSPETGQVCVHVVRVVPFGRGVYLEDVGEFPVDKTGNVHAGEWFSRTVSRSPSPKVESASWDADGDIFGRSVTFPATPPGSYPQDGRTLPPSPLPHPGPQRPSKPSRRPQPTPNAPPDTSGKSDPYGFTDWLNRTRARYGLRPVVYDPKLSAWAGQNNNAQKRNGLGHFVMGPARRQNSGMGSYAQIPGMWMASAPHRAALLDPSIRAIGIAGSGSYWTFNAY